MTLTFIESSFFQSNILLILPVSEFVWMLSVSWMIVSWKREESWRSAVAVYISRIARVQAAVVMVTCHTCPRQGERVSVHVATLLQVAEAAWQPRVPSLGGEEGDVGAKLICQFLIRCPVLFHLKQQAVTSDNTQTTANMQIVSRIWLGEVRKSYQQLF